MYIPIAAPEKFHISILEHKLICHESIFFWAGEYPKIMNKKGRSIFLLE